MVQFLFRFRIPRWPDPTSPFSHFPPAPTSSGRGISCTRLVKSIRLVKSNKMQQNVAKTGWELTKVARIGRSRSVYSQKRVAGGVGQSREPKLSVCCLHISAHPFLAKNRPGAPVFGHCPFFYFRWFWYFWYVPISCCALGFLMKVWSVYRSKFNVSFLRLLAYPASTLTIHPR